MASIDRKATSGLDPTERVEDPSWASERKAERTSFRGVLETDVRREHDFGSKWKATDSRGGGSPLFFGVQVA